MPRFAIEPVNDSGETLLALRDTATGAFALLWPGLGNNCIAARVPSPHGGLVDLLLAPDSLEQLRSHPSGWGIPLLFPSPGRIPQGEYEFQGRRFVMGGVDASGNVLHGFALRRSWRVDDTHANDHTAEARCSFTSDDHPETLEGFPFPYHVETTYRFNGSCLSLRVVIGNPGSGPLPFGFGVHPYFRIPFAEEGRRGECQLMIPADRRWNLPLIANVAEWTAPPIAEATLPVGEGLDYRTPVPLEDRLLDDVLTDLRVKEGWHECRVIDPDAQLEAVMSATAGFATLVVYTPPNRPGLCFEPWTCPPNAFNLAARGLATANVIVLAPGRQWEGCMDLSVRAP